MRKPVLLIFTNAMILIVVFVLLAQSLLVVQRLAQADKVQGVVEVQRGGRGDFVALVSGKTVAVGDVVRTGANGTVEFTWADKTRWKLTPNTQLIVANATINSAKNAENSQFQLDSGKLFVRIVKPIKQGSSFEVRTPRATASVQGTVFSVEVAPSGTTRVETFAGRVKLQSDGRTALVEAGNAAMTSANSIELAHFSGADFRAQTELIRPELSAFVKPMNKDIVIVRGETEVGNQLRINGQRALMLGNGKFGRRFPMKPGHNEWRVIATDKHGVQSSVCRAMDYDAKADTTSASACR